MIIYLCTCLLRYREFTFVLCNFSARLSLVGSVGVVNKIVSWGVWGEDMWCDNAPMTSMKEHLIKQLVLNRVVACSDMPLPEDCKPADPIDEIVT